MGAPFFAYWANFTRPIRMAPLGMAIWSLACLGTGLAPTFYCCLVARVFTGIGESSFLSIASTVIDAVAPSERRSLWLAVFYTAIPSGYAIGQAAGGIICDSSVFDGGNSWRFIFVLEALIGFSLVLFMAIMPGPTNMLELESLAPSKKDKGFSNNVDDDTLWDKFSKMCTDFLLVLIIFGYTTQTFVIGGLSFFGVKYMQEEYDLSAAEGGEIFGAVTLTTGIGGTLLGGFLLDRMKKGIPPEDEYSMARTSLRLIIPLMLFSTPISMVTWWIHSLPVVAVLLFFMETALFASITPINNAVMWIVELKDRSFALSLTSLTIHALGDAIAHLLWAH